MPEPKPDTLREEIERTLHPLLHALSMTLNQKSWEAAEQEVVSVAHRLVMRERERTITGRQLAEAWLRYTYLFGEPPHGTGQQMDALLELIPRCADRQQPELCPRCGGDYDARPGCPHPQQPQQTETDGAFPVSIVLECCEQPSEACNPENPLERRCAVNPDHEWTVPLAHEVWQRKSQQTETERKKTDV